MNNPVVFLAVTAMMFGGGVSAGQWTVTENTVVEVRSNVPGASKLCIIKRTGKLNSAPGEVSTVFQYTRKGGMPSSGECGLLERHVIVPHEKLVLIATHDW